MIGKLLLFKRFTFQSMVTGERGVLMVHAQKLVAQDLKLELGNVTVRPHQMVANLALVPHLLQPIVGLTLRSLLHNHSLLLIELESIRLVWRIGKVKKKYQGFDNVMKSVNRYRKH